MALDKSKLATMMKLQAQKPSAGQLLLKKQKVGAAPLPDEPEPMEMEEAPAKAKPALPEDSYERSLALPGMVEEAAQEAEAGADEELEGMIPSVYTEDGGPPAWADAEMWEQAKEAVGIGTPDEDRYEEPMAVVAYLYRKMGGPLGEGEESEGEESEGEESEGTGENEMGEEPEEAEGGVSSGDVRGMAGKLLAAKKMASAATAAPGDEAPAEDINALVEEAADEAMSSMDPEVAQYVAGYDAERDGNPPQWVTDEAAWEKAVEAVKPKFDDYEEPYAVVAHVYKKMGGGFKGKES